jgi:hypothetical protein
MCWINLKVVIFNYYGHFTCYEQWINSQTHNRSNEEVYTSFSCFNQHFEIFLNSFHYFISLSKWTYFDLNFWFFRLLFDNLSYSFLYYYFKWKSFMLNSFELNLSFFVFNTKNHGSLSWFHWNDFLFILLLNIFAGELNAKLDLFIF